VNPEPARAIRYEWFSTKYQHWIENGYCATIICDLSPDYVLDALDADRRTKDVEVAGCTSRLLMPGMNMGVGHLAGYSLQSLPLAVRR
jgi:hypothetical protein